MYSIEEKNELLQKLDKSLDGLTAAVAGLSEAQSNFKPSPNGWSVANIVEHLGTVEDFVILRVQQMPTAPDDGNFKDPDGVLFGRVADRSAKFQAPERVQPTGTPLAHSLERLVVSRQKIADLIRSAPDDHFRRHSMPHPVFGPLDGHQWMVAVAGHCNRHTQQIIETKAAPNFPEQ
jgi:hypothetical protein